MPLDCPSNRCHVNDVPLNHTNPTIGGGKLLWLPRECGDRMSKFKRLRDEFASRLTRGTEYDDLWTNPLRGRR